MPTAPEAPRPSRAESPRTLTERLRKVTRALAQAGHGGDEAIRALTAAAAEALNARRVSVWLYEDGDLIRCRNLFDASENGHDGGIELRRADYPAYFAALDDAVPIDAVDARTDVRTGELTREYLAPNGIGAMLDVPIWISGRLVGVVCHEHVGGTRDWTEDETALATVVGDLASLALETARRVRAEKLLATTEELLQQISLGVAGRTGSEFFQSIVQFLGQHLGADLAFVGELGERGASIRTVAAWRDGAPGADFDYNLVGSPCTDVLDGGACVYPKGVSQLFPEDRGLATMKAEAYVGTPLYSSAGTPMGLLVSVFKQPQPSLTVAESILKIMASRAAAELERSHVEAYRSRLEAELLRAQRLESVGRLAGGIAHDFNNLLAPITAYAEMGIDSLTDSDPIRDDLREILDAAERASRLTRQLLAFGRQQVLEKQTLDLNAVVEAFRGMIRPVLREDIEFSLELHGEPLTVLADEGQMDQVLMNLFVNAQDAMPDGGRLDVSTSTFTVPRGGDSELPDLDEGDYACLRVSDSGVGIDEDTAAHLFEPFFTTKRESDGTGLGLATVYGIVQQHGGSIHFRPRQEGGTRFDVYLPIERAASTADVPAPEKKVQSGSERILVVEDEGAVRRLVVNVLRRTGYEVVEAEGPVAALKLFDEGGLDVDLLLTDVVMPGMNGVELYKEVEARRPGTSVLYMSGYAHEVIAGKGLGDDINLLPKPFSVSDLTARVRGALQS